MYGICLQLELNTVFTYHNFIMDRYGYFEILKHVIALRLTIVTSERAVELFNDMHTLLAL